ncbi:MULTISPECIES: TetR/AcrR family transcriptional regulator [Streptosporangium]|uniref:AcrR family transcriptional regulator n=1 Tax=Streptosporangium brasiliense TaxID=47480 RepID=A0ABT9RK02_9ACTN|nr:TetR/AcrR family transcriptional regulator [Streptosporangium brasiliense]MDP9869151.1 AcrR family transcriptional regulator [Streptosporangium brasiliense]
MAGNTSVRRSQHERTKATMGALVAAARELFVAEGFSATAVDAICARAGVTRGAFYHHFSNKEHIFREVYAADQKDLALIVRQAFQAQPDPWDGMSAGCRRLLEASLEPAVRQITLVEAPGALGWSAMRDIQAGCKEQMRRGLAIAIEAGCIPDRPLDPATSLLYGGICESALDIARASDQRAALEGSLAELDLVLAGVAHRSAPGCAHSERRGAV